VEIMMAREISLSEAKARLSEVIRTVRRTRETVVVTVDGEPAVCIEPVRPPVGEVSAADLAIEKALWDAMARIPRPTEPFDAVDLVREGRR
jgi:prevent-host-death family protein